MRNSKRDKKTAFIAVGSNIDPELNIQRALEDLWKQVDIDATSNFYRTKPIGRPDQPMFVNGVWRILSDHRARELKFDVLHKIEENLGRIRTEDRFAPRTIDLDLILYGDEVIDEAGLSIPDPDIYTRAFVAIPLMELAPTLKIPGTLDPISSLPSIKLGDELSPLTEFSSNLKQRLIQ